MNEYDNVLVTDKGYNNYQILMVGAGEVVIFTTHFLPKEVQQLAANIAMQTFEHDLHYAKKGTRKDVPPTVKVATVMTNNLLQKSVEFVVNLKNMDTSPTATDPTDFVTFVQHTAKCKCNKPDVKKSVTFLCCQCKIQHHGICIKTKADFVCAPCSVQIDGVSWSTGNKYTQNTCPMDNTVTHFAIRASLDQEFAGEIKNLTQSQNNAVKAFAESVQHARRNQSAECHKKWHALKKNGISGLNVWWHR